MKLRTVFLLFCLCAMFSSVAQVEESLDVKIGQMLMLGIGDVTAVSDQNEMLLAVREGKVGGILLYEKNLTKTNSSANLSALTQKFQYASGTPLLISIDEEGGLVNRLKPKYGFPKTVSAKYLGDKNDIHLTRQYSDTIANNLKRHGINLNYAPVVDVHNTANPPIGKNKRSFSDNPSVITNHARAVVQSHRSYGVKTVLKHFPGHGNSSHDSHLDMTDVTKYWQSEELYPYQNLLMEGNVDAIMTAHIINCNLDTTCLPATLSKTILTDKLRVEMGYTGLIISDDMQMKAISDHFGFETSIKMAILAGVDVLMFSNHIPLKDRAFVSPEDIIAIVKEMVYNGEIPMWRIEESYRRVQRFKQGL